MTFAEFLHSIAHDSSPPAALSQEQRALWLARTSQWEQAHSIAQEIHTPVGSWIHALLHLIEGDTSNAAYWFHRAHKPVRSVAEIDSEWDAIAKTQFTD